MLVRTKRTLILTAGVATAIMALLACGGQPPKQADAARAFAAAPQDKRERVVADSVKPQKRAKKAAACAVCTGRGTVSKTCPYCSGKGYQGTSRNPQTCMVCKGTGFISEQCPACKGTGFVSGKKQCTVSVP